MRIVKENSGVHRYPELKLLSGSNYCDVGFERDPFESGCGHGRARQSYETGAAGQAVQAFNIRGGFAEDCGLEFAGLHPDLSRKP